MGYQIQEKEVVIRLPSHPVGVLALTFVSVALGGYKHSSFQGQSHPQCEDKFEYWAEFLVFPFSWIFAKFFTILLAFL